MKRAIVAPPALSPAALSEVKAWLGIATSRDDAELTALLMAALELCEGFTGTMPLQAGCEEVLIASADWQTLSTRPVQSVTGLSAIATDGTRTTLAGTDYEFDLDADGTGKVRLRRPLSQSRIAVRFTAGLSPDWGSLPDAIHHGILRLAAHQHRGRDDARVSPTPPAVVAALWRPWRRMRLT